MEIFMEYLDKAASFCLAASLLVLVTFSFGTKFVKFISDLVNIFKKQIALKFEQESPNRKPLQR